MDHSTVPMGFAMALAQNETAVNAYAMMTQEEKASFLAKAHQAKTKNEMQQLISNLAAEG